MYTAIAPATPDYRRDGTAIVTVLPSAESSVPAGQAAIARLEGALVGHPHVVGVGGDGASLIDFDRACQAYARKSPTPVYLRENRRSHPAIVHWVNRFIASQTALGRVGQPEDIGGVVASLLSEENHWVNAQRIEASGGMFL